MTITHTNAEYIQGLRDLADWLEAHPDAPALGSGLSTTVAVAFDLPAWNAARALISPCDANHQTEYLRFQHAFGPHAIQVIAPLATLEALEALV